ncbi:MULTISPECIES: hypothetical protein [Sphingobacterium]|uniref:hypothetical protein n=1 Tax=Sphingobacterium TaxID=28453 RepID=UPI0010E2D36E|nr:MULTISPECIES: hypothetical protein [Sphingobacterium]MCW2259518.1 hypothetical protein [Sphingobacterium kitahiroshimense]TCR14036.1 hypothetical protein EDF67_101139 [Sphingobacterium sp. JUb78]
MNDVTKIKYVFIALFSVMIGNAIAQEKSQISVINPPINTEILGSNRGLALQMIIDKKFKTIPKLGFFSVTSLVGEWDSNQINDYMTQASLTYDIAKGFKLAGGLHVTPVKGMRPIAGIIYTVANPTWLFVANSRIDYSKDTNVEGMFLVEYKPQINDNWRLYSRIQALYEYSTVINLQTRSYLMARAGLSYREITFGVGANIDYYGPEKHNENSIGGFLSFLLF